MSLSKLAARRRGFTLIELLIVIVVIAILSLIVIPKLMGASRKAKDATLKANLHIIRQAVEQFQADTGMYPSTLNDLTYAMADEASVMGYAVVEGEGAAQEETVPAGTYKGPYLKASGAVIAGTKVPVNPYIDEGDSTGETAIALHWNYTIDTDGEGVVKPVMGTVTTDAEGKQYSDY
jgi:type II secretion system protein G